jgi:hypothetical protein
MFNIQKIITGAIALAAGAFAAGLSQQETNGWVISLTSADFGY